MKCMILVLFFVIIQTLHLSLTQMYSLRGILMHPGITVAQKSSIQNLLYVTHEKWAIKRAIEFKQFHRYKCRDISADELALSGKIGLLKSSKKYNGHSSFVAFSKIYVMSEMLRTLTNRLSITSCISPRDRMRSASSLSNMNITNTNRIRKIYSYTDSLRSNQPQPLDHTQTNEFYASLWQNIDTFDTFTKRAIRAKYDYEFNVIRSNKLVAELMCCSEETVRKSVNKWVYGIKIAE